jgi:hypothetical protein
MNEFINPITLAIGLLALGPFLAIMISSFVKIAVVFLLLRNALGLQQIPPNLAVNGLALILSLYIMAPVGYAIYDILKAPDVDLQRLENPATQQAFRQAGARVFCPHQAQAVASAVRGERHGRSSPDPAARFYHESAYVGFRDRFSAVPALSGDRPHRLEYPARHGHDDDVADDRFAAV